MTETYVYMYVCRGARKERRKEGKREEEEKLRTSRITISKHISPPIDFDIADRVQDLVEQVHQLNRIPRRARAIVDVGHVGHVAVVWLVEVDAIPARLELYLSTEAIVAHRHVHLWRFGIR